MAKLLSVNVGLPRVVDWGRRAVRTGIWKEPVQGRRHVGRLNVEGDGQGDLSGHGGEQRAVLVYQIDSYRHWQDRLGLHDLVCGQFGENFTVDGLPDDEVCIGDRYRIGTALFEVTQPRVTCFRLGIRMSQPQMPALLTSSGRPGFYFRVIEEGDVGAGDSITLIAKDPQGMTVAEINALLYSSSHPRDQLERALRVSALSPGWRWSFEALLRSEGHGETGNAGLAPTAARRTAAPGFRGLHVSRVEHESTDVISFTLQPTDERPLTIPLPGQFVVLRLRPSPGGAPLFRSYSLSGAPSGERYRISVKLEPHGAAGGYLGDHVGAGDLLDVSEPRGSFVLEAGERPVVLLSAGIGATPVLAMLHTLATNATSREVWWVHGARNGKSHAFAVEVRSLLALLPRARGHVCYSGPTAADRPGRDYDSTGRMGVGVLEELGAPRDADFYICGPSSFLNDLETGLAGWGVAPNQVHHELFAGGPSMTPGVVSGPARAPHLPTGALGTGPLVSFARSGIAVRWRQDDQSLLELAEACDLPVRWSCRSGVCHNCEVGLISGSVAYDPAPLDPPAQGNVLICCSRPEKDVVVDA